MKTWAISAITLAAIATSPALAADKKKGDELPTINKCATSYGSIAIADGDNQGWAQLGLGSPRELLETVVAESGCFTVMLQGSGGAAKYLMSAVAGSNEEVNQNKANNGGQIARAAGIGGIGGKALGMLGGLGGKKKTVSVALRVLSPASGATLAQASAESTKSSFTLGGPGGFGWANKVAGVASNYMNSKEGAQLGTAFINAFNSITAQGAALSAAPAPAAAAPAGPVAAVATNMYATASKTGTVVRALRQGTPLTATGKREGQFLEMKDNFGTVGWVPIEDVR